MHRPAHDMYALTHTYTHILNPRTLSLVIQSIACSVKHTSSQILKHSMQYNGILLQVVFIGKAISVYTEND